MRVDDNGRFRSDGLETETLVKLGFNWFSPVTWPLGMAVKGAGKLVGGTVSGAARLGGWAIAKHPGKTLSIGLPVGMALYQAPDLFNKYQNNVNPQNPYQE